MAASAALLLWLNRGTTFFFDEMVWFADLSTYEDPSAVLVPHNSHLHGTTRVVYWLSMELFGTEYIVMRLLGAASVLLCAGVFFALARRRVGDLAALVPAVLLLFYGSAWQHVVGPIGFTVLLSIAAGLGALLALERGDRRGDATACALACLSAFTFTVGLGFLVGVAISVLVHRDRLRRAWIFGVPLALYSSWWLWSQQFDQGRTEIANLDHVVPFFAQATAVTTGALTGVNVPFARFGDTTSVAEAPASILGWIVAAVFVAALIWRISRGAVPRSLWASLGVVGTYWLAAALSDLFGNQADAVRYVYPGSIGILLVATDAARGLRVAPRATAALLAVAVFSLAMNLVFLRDGAGYLRDHSATVKANLAMLELGSRSNLASAPGPAPRPDASPMPDYLGYGPDPEDYLAAVAEYGSPAFSIAEVRVQPPATRHRADIALIDTYDLAVEGAGAPANRESCRRSRGGERVPLPAGGALLRPLDAIGPLPLSLSRFGEDPGPVVGEAGLERWSVLRIPTDDVPEPWLLKTPAERPLLICPPG